MIRRLLVLALLVPSLAWAACVATDAYSTLICSLGPTHYYRLGDDPFIGTMADNGNATTANGSFSCGGGVNCDSVSALITNTTDAAFRLKTSGAGASLPAANTDLMMPTGASAGWSVDVWWKNSAAGGEIVSMGGGGATNYQYSLYNNSNTNRLILTRCNSVTYLDTGNVGTPADGSIHHTTVTTLGDGSSGITHALLYIDGTLISTLTGPGSGTFCTTTTSGLIGAQPPGNNWLGTADELAYFNFELSQAQITNIQNTGTAPAGLPIIGRRLYESRRTVIDPYLLPVAFGPREPQPFPLNLPTFMVDALNRRAIRSHEVYAQ